MANPFSDPQTHRTRFAPSPVPSPYPDLQPSYPPASHHTLNDDDGTGDVGYGRRGGVQVNGQHVPWVAGEEDDELKPLTAG